MKHKLAVILFLFGSLVLGLFGCGGSDRPRNPVKILNATDSKLIGRIDLTGLKKAADGDGGGMMPGGGGGGMMPGGGGPGPGPGPAPGPAK